MADIASAVQLHLRSGCVAMLLSSTQESECSKFRRPEKIHIGSSPCFMPNCVPERVGIIKQVRQCTHNVTLRRVHVTFAAVGRQ